MTVSVSSIAGICASSSGRMGLSIGLQGLSKKYLVR